MGFLQLFGIGKTSDGAKHCAVDAESFAGADNQRRGRLAPRDQLRVIEQLGRFAKKENITITAVFIGEPLRKLGDGDDLSGVKVLYVADEKELVRKLLKDSSGGLLVSSEREVEKAAQDAGRVTMRASTFRKSFDGVGGNDRDRNDRGGDRHDRGGDRNDRGDRGERGGDRNDRGGDRGFRRPPQRRERDQQGGNEGGNNHAPAQEDAQHSSRQDNDRVSELIDLVEPEKL